MRKEAHTAATPRLHGGDTPVGQTRLRPISLEHEQHPLQKVAGLAAYH